MKIVLYLSGIIHDQTPEMNAQYRTKYWLSDPACYPIMIILGGAVSMCAGFGLHFFFTSPDVQITPGRRYVCKSECLNGQMNPRLPEFSTKVFVFY
jgi:hypothetical protein